MLVIGWGRLAEEEINMVWHYTSLDVLYNIINNSVCIPDYNDEGSSAPFAHITLYATHSSCLNDWSEGNVVPKVLKALGLPENYIRTARFRNITDRYILSFSHKENDLNQWRAYGDNGRGVALGFDENSLKKLCEEKICDCDTCEYCTPRNLKRELEQSEIYINALDKYNIRKEISEFERMMSHSFLYKDKAFQEESEFRIVLSMGEQKFRMNNRGIIPYVEFQLDASILKSIYFGPNMINPRKIMDAVRKMIISKHISHDINMKISKIPYRN